jgi:prefoldin alpha subunit
MENITIDVGTGYYVQKARFCLLVTSVNQAGTGQTRAQAVKHYEDKIEYIKKNLDTLQETIQKKQDNLNYLVNVVQSKLHAHANNKD